MRLSSGTVGHFPLQRKQAGRGLEMVSGSPSRWASEMEPVRRDFQNNKGFHAARSVQIHQQHTQLWSVLSDLNLE